MNAKITANFKLPVAAALQTPEQTKNLTMISFTLHIVYDLSLPTHPRVSQKRQLSITITITIIYTTEEGEDKQRSTHSMIVNIAQRS
jgi:hypothetical protein